MVVMSSENILPRIDRYIFMLFLACISSSQKVISKVEKS